MNTNLWITFMVIFALLFFMVIVNSQRIITLKRILQHEGLYTDENISKK